MKTFNVSKSWLEKLSSLKNKIFSDEEMHRKLDCLFLRGGKTTKKKVLEACAIAAYHQRTDIPVVTALLSDDARQFQKIAYHHALCWIHDGRNYKKLRPIVPYYKEKLEAFLDMYWDFYGELCEFRINPESEVAEQLSIKFDQLFLPKQDMNSWMKESLRRRRTRNIY